MKKHLLLTITAIVLLASVVLPRATRQADASAEEYAVYSAVIANMFAAETVTFDTPARIKLLVIKDQTSTDPTRKADPDKEEQYFRKMFPTLTEGVVWAYLARNTVPIRLKDSFDLKVKQILIGKQEIEKIFSSGWWEEFYKRYPDSGGFISLSRVGFSPAMSQALVYIQHNCGETCATGTYVLLEKSVDGWRVVKREGVWIS